eukprot:m.48888 g.48888  ORF g.48888 m.48888 type:complete len:363 (-) comp47831_c0_seq2:129-1217(-)
MAARKPKPLLSLQSVVAPQSQETSQPSPLPDPSPTLAPRPDNHQFNRLKLVSLQDLSSADFENEAPLGSGNGGVVWKVKHKASGLLLARKMIRLEIKPKVREQIVRELKVLHDCESDEIIGFYGSFASDMDINVLMEYMDVGSLDKVVKRVGRFEEDVVRNIASKVLLGLTYLRDKFKIMHRDIKPSNILANSEGAIKLCDFGVSGELTNSLASTFTGTRAYMAPERFLGTNYTVESDIWSLGLSLLEMATGRFPIPYDAQAVALVPLRAPTEDQDTKAEPPLAIFELLGHIVDDPPPRLPKGCGFSAEFEDFIDECCAKEPADRPNLAVASAHAWIEGTSTHPVDMAAWAKSTLPPPPPSS